MLNDKTKMRPLIIKSIITATFYVSSTVVQIADPTILLIPIANAMRLSATIVFLFSSATGSTTEKNTRNRNVKSNFHEFYRSLNTNKHSFDWHGNGKLNRRRAISSKEEATIKQQKLMPLSATTPTTRLNWQNSKKGIRYFV